jgi:DNA-binding NtrC family response regulator
VKEAFTILITDRNPRVTSFLQRELARSGYQVRVAEDAQSLLKEVCEAGPVHLVILDPDLLDTAASSLLEQLQGCIPKTPVVIHTHYPNSLRYRPEALSEHVFVVEKSGSSIERLKLVAAALFETHLD